MFSFFKKKERPADPPPVLVPRIKHTNFLTALDGLPGVTDVPESSRPIVEPLAGDLVLSYAMDIGPSYVSVTPASLAEYGLDPTTLRQQALANGLEALKSLSVRTNDVVFELVAPDNMAACTMLFPEFWEQTRNELGSPVVAAFPHRDFVLYARDDAAGTAALREIIASLNFDETHALSKLLYYPARDGWRAAA